MKKIILSLLIFFSVLLQAQIQIPQVVGLTSALNSKVDKATGKSLVADTLAAKIQPHVTNLSNPHSVTKAQVGLSNVDNTPDISKPISTATQTALNGKQDNLVSGTSIRTVNGNSVLGSGDIQIVSGGGGSPTNIYLSNVASSVAGYKNATPIIDPTETIKTITASTANTITWGEKYLYISPVATTIIPSGIWELHAYGFISTATGVSQLAFRILRYSGSTETVLATLTGFDVNNTSDGEMFVTGSTNDMTVLSGDYLGIQVGLLSDGTAPAITLTYSVGNGHATHFNTPLPTRHASLRDKNGEIDFQHLTAAQVATFTATSANNTVDETLTSIKTKLGAASASNSGYLTNTDWGNFNGKQPAGEYLTSEIDGSITNELQTISTNGSAGNITLSNSGGTLSLNVNDADASPINEIQDLSLSGNTLTLSSDATTVDISQATAVLANTAKISNANHTGDATGSTVLTLATVNSNIGTYNNVTINAKGLVTAGSNVSYLTSFTETDPTIYEWAKSATKPSYAYSEITSKPTLLSQFTNDLGNYGGWITGITSGQVTGALGYTPWWSSNHPTTVSGYGITDIPTYSGSNFILNQNSSAQSANMWISGDVKSGAATFASTVQATQLQSTVATGTAPLTVNSTTMVSNLNAQYLGGNLASAFQPAITGLSPNYLPKWNGSSIINSLISDDGVTASLRATKPVLVFSNSSGSVNYGIMGSDGNIFGGSVSDFGMYVYGNNNYYIATNNTKRLTIDGNGITNITSTTQSTSPANGALVVNGGIGADHVRANNFYGSLTGNASTATNVAYSGLTGTVPTWNQNTTGSASTLTTTRTIWGQNFNGAGNVSGAISGATTGDFSGDITVTSVTQSDMDGITINSGSIKTNGGISAVKDINAGGDINAFGNMKATGTITSEGHQLTPVYQNQTTVDGSTSGYMICSMPIRTGTYKKVIIDINGMSGTATYTFPVAFTKQPEITSDAVPTANQGLSTTSMTVSGQGYARLIILEGY